MTKLKALECYMEELSITFLLWDPENALRENEFDISEWQQNDEITDDWKNFLLDYNTLLARFHKAMSSGSGYNRCLETR